MLSTLSDLYPLLLTILAFDGLLMAFLLWAVTSKRYGKYRIRTPETYRIPKEKKIKNISMNMALSLGLLLSILYVFQGFLVSDVAVSGVTVFGQVIGSLLLYDFMYYFMHRTMHHPKLMKYVHGVHHFVRFPTSVESIYLHPLENIAGLTLLMISIAIVGPISILSFGIVFFVYSTINILVHSNLDLPHPAFRLLNFWALKHDLHHGKHLNKNYASITPFWDFLFGTYA